MRQLVLIVILGTCIAGAYAQFGPPPLSPIGKKIQAAVDSDIRTAAEKERDANRKPRETLEFFQLREDMRVIELVPAGGWYTKIIGPVVADKGKLYVTLGTRRIGAVIEQHEELSKVEIIPVDAQFKPTETMGLFGLDEFSIDVEPVDLVLTFRNLHNFVPEARASVNEAVYDVLKPGGLYGVVDHTRRHNDPDTRENWRRMDPVLAIKEIQAAGFELVDFSDVHYRPDDELRFEVGRKSVRGNSDRFTLLFRKPE
ncbi:MAG: methyltransferase [Gammaproteobacteria bacterium]|nr:methyltransferase [Gammaproteobacteria bacterium]